ncbi:MAG: SH3 domain-containing protein [Enterocloster clostridioformis]
MFIDTSWQPQGHGSAGKEAGQVRVRGGVKSQIITEAAAGETVDVLETMEKWSRVRTSDGYIGYVENRKLEAGEQVAPVSTFEACLCIPAFPDGKVRLGFHQVTRPEGNNTPESYVSNARG